MDHQANSLFNSLQLSPGTNNLIAMKKRRVDRSGFNEDTAGQFISKEQYCRDRKDINDTLER